MRTRLIQIIIMGILLLEGCSCNHSRPENICPDSSDVTLDSLDTTPAKSDVTGNHVGSDENYLINENPIDSARILVRQKGCEDYFYLSLDKTGYYRISKIINGHESDVFIDFSSKSALRDLKYLYAFFIKESIPIEESREYVGWYANEYAPIVEFTFNIYIGKVKIIKKVVYQKWPTKDCYEIKYSPQFFNFVRILSNMCKLLNNELKDNGNSQMQPADKADAKD